MVSTLILGCFDGSEDNGEESYASTAKGPMGVPSVSLYLKLGFGP